MMAQNQPVVPSYHSRMTLTGTCTHSRALRVCILLLGYTTALARLRHRLGGRIPWEVFQPRNRTDV
jgi:hypothetical protein